MAHVVSSHSSLGFVATLVWDAENRLVKATVGSTVMQYDYDYLSRLVKVSDGTGTKHFLYDGWNRIAEYGGATGTTHLATYLWGLDLSGSPQGAGGVGGLLSIVASGGGARYYPAYDGNGNVSQYVSQTGAEVARFEYDPFGNLTVDAYGNATSFPYRFSTKLQDGVTGLYYYGYRWFDPVTGRWPSRDPIEEDGGLNLYGFVRNDGINYYDILGLVPPGISRHHWLPRSLRGDIEKICKGIDIDKFVTPMDQSGHGMIEHQGKYRSIVRRFIESAPSCCDFLLFIRDLMRASLMMSDVGSIRVDISDPTRPLLEDWKERAGGRQNNTQEFDSLMFKECGKRCRKARSLDPLVAHFVSSIRAARKVEERNGSVSDDSGSGSPPLPRTDYRYDEDYRRWYYIVHIVGAPRTDPKVIILEDRLFRRHGNIIPFHRDVEERWRRRGRGGRVRK